jgi:hypothetical protein
MGDLAMAAGEAISGFAGAGAEAAAPVFETGVGTIGGGLGEAAAGTGGGIADIVGSGAGLFGGTTGLEGTALAGGAGDIAGLIGGGGATALGTAEAFMGAPGASGFNPSAMTPQAFGGTSSFGPASASLSPNVANANAGASVFDTGASPLTGVSGTGAPSAGTSASSVAAPAGVSGVPDPTAVAGGTAATAGQAAKSTSIGDLLGKAGGSVVDSVTKNPVGTALGAAGLGYNIMAGQKQSANQAALTADAKKATANSDQMVASGEALQKYMTDGTLPPAYQQQVDNAINDAKTTAISNAAAQGQPTDPTKNTSLAATLAKIDASRAGMQAQVASQLFSSGSSLINSGQSAANLSGNLYGTLVQNDTAQAANTGKAIATLAAAMNGKSQANLNGITISQG